MKPEDRVTWSKALREQIERPRSESLVERVREMAIQLEYVPIPTRDIIRLLKDVIPVLEDYERYYSTKQAFAGDGELEGESEERASQERRTLAKAQMACRLFEGYAAVAGLTTEERIAAATHVAEQILRACEEES